MEKYSEPKKRLYLTNIDPISILNVIFKGITNLSILAMHSQIVILESKKKIV